MAASTRKRRRAGDLDRERLERAADLYLHACYGTRTAARADEFAQYLRIARPHLSRIAPQILGMSLREFLRRKQVDHAKELLRSTPLSVDEIAVASAFGTPWTFYRCFRSVAGVTPARFRRGRKILK
ncbi:MAG TPA: helix-turn-helix domain-containing protein [Thermoanaerobaculia bacterium]|jgi:transcriptional regulator GlxA family with amidase domain|nr:helix-turn-helix domain-containing protein [Thermoanaerobaculia bacterium]